MKKSDKKFKRKCIICNEYKEKTDLIRFIQSHDTEEKENDKNIKIFGRSFYICDKRECLEKALKSKALSKYTKLNTLRNITKTIKEILNSENN
ncbi:YlxR family protein [bacterium]|nr:YlxR family protein [bacterium]